MKRLHFFAVSVIIVLSVPQIGNSSVGATNLKQWGELISSLDSYFIQHSDILAKKKPAISGWQLSEPKLVKKAPTLIKPDYQYCLLYTSPSPRDKRQSRMPSSA